MSETHDQPLTTNEKAGSIFAEVGDAPFARIKQAAAAAAATAPPFLSPRYLSGLAAHAVAAAASAVVIALVAAGMLVGAVGGMLSDATDTFGVRVGALFRLAFAGLLSLSSGGAVYGSAGGGAFGAYAETSMVLHGVPVFLTACFAAATVWAGIALERRMPTPSGLWRAAVGVATGLVAAAVVSIVAAASGGVHLDASAFLDLSVRLHISVGGPGVFFVGWLIFGAAAVAGRQIGHWGGIRASFAKAPTALRDAAAWAGIMGIVFGALAVVLVAAGAIMSPNTAAVLLTAPLSLGAVFVSVATLGHFGVLTASAGTQGSIDVVDEWLAGFVPTDGDAHASVFSLPDLIGTGWGYLVWVTVALAVLTVFIAGRRIGAMRARRAASPVSRVLTVVIVAIIALVGPLLITPRVAMHGEITAGEYGSAGADWAVSLGIAAWTFLLFVVTAVLVDLVAQHLAPGMAARRPLSKGARRGIVITASTVGGLAVLTGGFFAVVAAVNNIRLDPERPVAAYLSDIASGDFAAAAKATGGVTQAAIAATPDATIENPHIVSSTVDGDRGTVKFRYTLDGRQHSDNLDVVDRGGLFRDWQVTSPLTYAVNVSDSTPDYADVSASHTVGGTPLGDAGAYFPGVYTVAPQGGRDLLTADPVKVHVAAGTAVSAAVQWRPTAKVTEEVQAAVNNWIDASCFADDMWYGSCYLSDDVAYADEDASLADGVTWSNVAYPTVSLNDDGTFSTSKDGTAKASWTNLSWDEDDIFAPPVESRASGTDEYTVSGSFTISRNGAVSLSDPYGGTGDVADGYGYGYGYGYDDYYYD